MEQVDHVLTYIKNNQAMRKLAPVVVLFIIGIIGFSIYSYTHVETYTSKITGKERVVVNNGESIDSYYLIYTDEITFKLEDDLFRGNFNSSDIYGRIKIDSTYTITTSGFRIGVLSSYPNIIKLK